MAGRFEGKVAVVTGAGNGIGRAAAHVFAREGAKAVVNDLGDNVYSGGNDSSAAQKVVDETNSLAGGAICLPLSDNTQFITSQVRNLNGGWSAREFSSEEAITALPVNGAE